MYLYYIKCIVIKIRLKCDRLAVYFIRPFVLKDSHILALTLDSVDFLGGGGGCNICLLVYLCLLYIVFFAAPDFCSDIVRRLVLLSNLF